MKISTILDHIDSGHMALPEFQRGYVWSGDQVRGLFDSLYRRHPVGGLLVWATEAKTAAHRGDGPVVSGIVKLLLDGFFATQSGLAIRATGSNARMARAQGVNTGMAILAGMALSNALVGLAGALFAQTQGGADISMGVGTIVIGLAAVIVGESLLPSRKLYLATIAVIVGAIVYRFFIALALNSDFIGLQAQDLNLVTAVLVTVALVVPRLRAHWSGKRVS